MVVVYHTHYIHTYIHTYMHTVTCVYPGVLACTGASIIEHELYITCTSMYLYVDQLGLSLGVVCVCVW